MEHGDQLGVVLDRGLVIATLYHRLKLAETNIVVKGSKWVLGAGGYSGPETGPEGMGFDKGGQEMGGAKLRADGNSTERMSVNCSLEVPVE